MKKIIPISRIARDHDIQIRLSIDEELVGEYAAIVAEHQHMDPITVFTKDPEHITKDEEIVLADGFHRVGAYLKCGREEIPAEILAGGRSEALEYAITRNCKNGLRMSNADKRRAAELAIADARLGEMPDAKLAKKIGVSSALVNEVRRGITQEQKRKRAKSVRVGSHVRAAPEPVDEQASRPTRKKTLDQIRIWIADQIIEEGDLIDLFDEDDTHYRFVPKPGRPVLLKVVGKSNRPQMEIEATVKLISGEELVLKYEGEGSIGVIAK
jgi:hypothetical protein